MIVLLLQFVDLTNEFIGLLRRHWPLPIRIHIISKTISNDDGRIVLKESIGVAYCHTLTLSMLTFRLLTSCVTSEYFHF